jgi:hypothetical protein
MATCTPQQVSWQLPVAGAKGPFTAPPDLGLRIVVEGEIPPGSLAALDPMNAQPSG